MNLLRKDPVLFWATVGGAGHAAKAPGTVGTLAGLPFCGLLLFLPGEVQVTLMLTACVLGMIVCDLAARRLGQKDPSCIVLDEVIGLGVTLMLFPFSLTSLVLGFILFRIFDILKPWPVAFFDEEVGGGAGIVMDDVAAGLFARFCLSILSCFPWLGMGGG